MIGTQLRTAGPGGDETTACKLFGDDVYEIIALSAAAMANTGALLNRELKADGNAVGQLFFEMCWCRGIDACLTYVSNVLRLVFTRHPNVLKSSEKVDVDFVLQFGSIDDLITALLERKVHSLSYRSLDDLDAYLLRTLDISLFAHEEQRSRAVRLVDVRNLIVHNRGTVNQMFKKRNPESVENVGDRIRCDQATSLGDLLFLVDWIMDLDVRFIAKFALPRQPRVPRPKPPLITDLRLDGTA